MKLCDVLCGYGKDFRVIDVEILQDSRVWG